MIVGARQHVCGVVCFIGGLLFGLFRPSSAVLRQGENETLSVTIVTEVSLRHALPKH